MDSGELDTLNLKVEFEKNPIRLKNISKSVLSKLPQKPISILSDPVENTTPFANQTMKQVTNFNNITKYRNSKQS